MSNRALFIALGCAAVLIGFAIALSRLGGSATPAPGAQPLAPWFDASQVASITLEQSGAPRVIARRSPAGQWSVGEGASTWPAAMPEAAQRSIAYIADAPAAAPAQGGEASPDAAWSALTFDLASGQRRVLRISPSALGGAYQASLDGAALAPLEASVVQALAAPGPLAWRIPRAAPGARDTSRLTITEASGTIALGRVLGEWSMRRPAAARADASAVASLLDALASIPVVRFEALPAPAGAPRLSIDLETDERQVDARGEVKVVSRPWLLRVFGPVNPDGTELLARAGADEASLVSVVIPASAVASLSTAPRNYLAPTLSAVSPADVFVITISDGPAQRGYRRELAGWSRLLIDGSKAPADAQPIEDALAFFTGARGEPEPAGADDDLRTVQRVELFNQTGDRLELLSVGYTADAVPAVRTGNLVVLFPKGSLPALLEVPSFESLPPGAEPQAPLAAPPENQRDK